MTRITRRHSRISEFSWSFAAASTLLLASAAHATPTLEGWANLPANTTSTGPTTGQFGGTGFGANSGLLPILHGQAVQGFSAVLPGPRFGTLYVMPDNGFGNKANSADALLRVYAVRPEFRLWNGRSVVGSGQVRPVKFRSGGHLAAFSDESYISLRDPDRKIGFAIQADFEHYYNLASNPVVDPSIKAGRLLTGADFDIESIRKDKWGNLWFGEEFGPYLLKADKTGKVLRAAIPLPNFRPVGSSSVGAFVQSPQNPEPGATANLGASRGFEGMAINKSRDKLYTLLEGTVTGDVAATLRIDEFDIKTEKYTGKNYVYKLDARGTNIGDMTAINDHEFLVIERNGETGTSAGVPFKRVFVIDVDKRDAKGFVGKRELVDLMNVADPHDLNGDGNTLFTFPYVTIESVLIVSPKTLLILNDDNFPGGGGRSAAPDSNEFLLIRLDEALDVREDACDHHADAHEDDEDED